uniref:TSA: Wollemia nobilis Ref_Wollemi_Transcript_14169_1790 transcribed RNA sequence n=1 Tax=Wollemia nobilis TaxID=56998 RepID=A0A0C9RT40_9CONI
MALRTFLHWLSMEFFSITWITLPVALLISVVIYRKLSSKSKLPPGPRALPIIGNLHMLSGLPYRSLYNLAHIYGPIMTVYFGSLPTIIISSPQMAKLVLKTHDPIFANRPLLEDGNDTLYENPSTIAFAPSGPYWKFMRKTFILELLSPKRLESFRSLRAQEASAMIRSILQTTATNANCGSPSAVDISREVSIFTNNIICRMTFGKKFCEDELGGKVYKDILEERFALASAFSYGDFVPLLGWLDLQGVRRRQGEIHKLVYGFLERVVEEHFEGRKKNSGLQHGDFVDLLISLCEDDSTEVKITRQHIKFVIFDILAGGTDTAGNTLEWAMSELLRNPSAMKRAQEELDSVVGRNRIVKESDLSHLQYLQAVVKETLRLYPPVPLLLQRESMECCTIAGYELPQKTRVFVNAWAIGRDPTAWEDANEFKPERFLERKIDVKGHDLEVIPFGSGRRGCPGINLGLTTVQLGLAQLLHCFDWYLPGGITPHNLDMSEAFLIVMPRAVHLQAIPAPRLALDLYEPKAECL